MNRRDIFKGAAGAAAASVLAAESNAPRAATRGQYSISQYPGPAANILQHGLNPIPDPFHAAKQLLVKHASEQRELLIEQLSRKQESLGRMKSVSEAYKRYMYDQYHKETRAIHDRWEHYVNGIWGVNS